jgi:hypothetical protein
MREPSPLGETLHEQAAALLAAAGSPGAFQLTPLAGGANNRVFRVNLAGATVVLKVYCRPRGDPRDRLGAEYAFATFAWQNGVRSLPRPIACDPHNALALFEYVVGRKLTPAEVTEDSVRQALGFFLDVNAGRGRPEAQALPEASEACFTLEGHCRCLERRLERLARIEVGAEIDVLALQFVQRSLVPLAAAVLEPVRNRARGEGIPLHAEIPAADRCISPSDFGFHNALWTADGRLVFLDFEYAGWDDPAKTVSDFFCQPECPAPVEHYGVFAQAVVRSLSEPTMHMRRLELLLPVYRLKWCCILLNDFLPAGSSRRRFAGASADETQRKTRQLDKARAAAAGVLSPADALRRKMEP